MNPLPLTSPASWNAVCLRFSHSLIGMKIVAELLLLLPLMRSNPLTMKMFSIASFLPSMTRNCSVVFMVRSSVAPSGNCTAVIMKPWSSGGTKLPGTRQNRNAVIPSTTANTDSDAMRRTQKMLRQPMESPVKGGE